jgi:sugar lactone lactonase YvrE
MNTSRLRDLRAIATLLFAGLGWLAPQSACGQFAAALETNSRYAGSSTGTSLYNGDTGAAISTSLNAPSYTVFDSAGNLYISDTLNNCVRRIDSNGNISTVAGLRVSGGPDTCNTAGNPTPIATQGLLRPTGLAIDSKNTLYIADSLHNCVRSLAFGAVDSFAANALTTAAGTCSSNDTASVTPVPNGLTVDGSGNLYVSIRDSAAALPVNQVVRHLATDPATNVCYVAGQPSANVANACAGVTGTVTLSSPAGLAFDPTGNLFFADTGNNCVREVVSLTTQQTAVGQCGNDHSGNSATALASPYGLAFSPAATLYISEAGAGNNNVAVFAPGYGTLTLVAGLPNGSSGAYSALLDGQSSLSAALDSPLGLTTDATGNLYLADSLNNVVRKMSSGLFFPATAAGTSSVTQTVTFSINRTVNLSATAGPDYSIAGNTCSGALAAGVPGAPPNTCQVMLKFTPSRPGARNSALQLKDALSNQLISLALTGTGTGPLGLFTPGTVNSIAKSLRTPIAAAMDSAGDAYILEQGNGTDSADILMIPAGGGAPVTVVAQGAGLRTPTALAVDAAGNVFVSDAGFAGVTRYGADGSTNVAYVTGLLSATALAVDAFDNLYIAQAGSTHNVIEVYAGGTKRVVAGSGAIAGANGVPAANAQFLAPSGLVLGPAGLSIADANGHYVYTIDGTGTIHIIAGNGTAVTTSAGQALGTGLLLPVGLAADAAGDIYIADEASNRVYEVYPVASNGVTISAPLGSGATGYTGDGGPGPVATLNAPIAVGLDGSSNLYTVDSVNGALREVSYPVSPSIDFGDVIIGAASKVIEQSLANAGNAAISINTPFTTTDSHFAVSTAATATTCAGTEAPGATCMLGFTVTPTGLGPLSAQSVLTSNDSNSPQIIQLSAYGLYTQNLPYTLSPETEVYGQPFTEMAQLTLVYPDLTPTGTMVFSIAGETTCVISGPFSATINCPATESGLGVGTYTVNFTYTSGDPSYAPTTGKTTLTITPGSMTMTPTNESKPYGAPVPGLPGILSGEVNGDVFLFANSTTATASSPVGTYPITTTLTPVALASLSNYNVQYIVGTLTVTPLPLTVTISSATRAYGAANPTLTSTVTGGINGDTFTVTIATLPGVGAAAGTYSISATVTGANIGNYAVTVVPGTFTVTPIPLTVTVANATRAYGTANPTFTATVSGAINGDTFTNSFSTPATIASPVGSYPISDVLGGPSAADYTVTVVPGTLTVTPATNPLTITANNATRVYGAANPAFTSTITGALNGDSFTIAYTTTATPASPVGGYAIVPTVSGAALANYAALILNNGTLTVAPATTAVALATSASPVFVGTGITFPATVGSAAGVPPGAVNFSNGTTLLGTSTVNGSGVATFTTASLTPGTYNIVATYQATANFAASSGTVAQVVSPGTFTLTATPPSQFVRGPGTTTYAVNVSAMQSFSGSVVLRCSGLPADATCAFSNPTLNLSVNGTATTNMVVVNTAADAKLTAPALRMPGGRSPSALLPVIVAAVFPLELTGLGAFLAGMLRRRKRGRGDVLRSCGTRRKPSAKLRLLLATLCTAGLIGIAGCACLTSAYQNYTITITGTNAAVGSQPQTTSVLLSVGAQ